MLDPESPQVPAAVKELHLRLVVREGDPREHAGTMEFHVLDADGRSMAQRQGDVFAELGDDHAAALSGALDALLDKARGTIPAPADMAAALTALASDAVAIRVDVGRVTK